MPEPDPVTDQRAMLAGATGLIGRHLLAALLAAPQWSEVRVLARREIAHNDPKLSVTALDFDSLPTLSDRDPALFDVDAIFCCLGTTIKTAGSRNAFRKVDHDYIVNLARVGKAAGARQFLLISAVGANAKSPFFYNRVKGETEDAIKALGYEALHIFQPSLLMGERSEHRTGEAVAQKLMPVFSPLLAGGMARYRPVQAETVAQAMLQHAESGQTGTFTHHYDGTRFS